jgi:hypothetical protein
LRQFQTVTPISSLDTLLGLHKMPPKFTIHLHGAWNPFFAPIKPGHMIVTLVVRQESLQKTAVSNRPARACSPARAACFAAPADWRSIAVAAAAAAAMC